MSDPTRISGPLSESLRRTMWRWLWCLRLPLLKHRIRRCRIQTFDDLNLVILPGVLDPVLLRSGVFLAENIQLLDSADPPNPENPAPRTALDMGTGSGLGALIAARNGYDVIAVDISPVAVRCARANAVLNGLDARIRVLEGDLFHPLPDIARFDLVAFNPPFFRGPPHDIADMAWRGEDVVERFSAGLEQVLNPNGTALVLLSTDGEQNALEILQSSGLLVRPVAHRDFGNETMTVYAITRKCVAPGGMVGQPLGLGRA